MPDSREAVEAERLSMDQRERRAALSIEEDERARSTSRATARRALTAAGLRDLLAENSRLAERLREVEGERDHWRNQHDEQVRRKREGRQRLEAHWAEITAPPEGWRCEVCKRCGRHNVVGFDMPDDVWATVVRDRWNVLCLTCFDQLAAPLGIDWARPDQLKLYVVSTAAGESDGPIPEYVRWQADLAAQLAAAERVVEAAELLDERLGLTVDPQDADALIGLGKARDQAHEALHLRLIEYRSTYPEKERRHDG